MPGILARMRDPVLTAALVAEGWPRRVEEAPALAVRVHPTRRPWQIPDDRERGAEVLSEVIARE
jgi:hypothetical protein